LRTLATATVLGASVGCGVFLAHCTALAEGVRLCDGTEKNWVQVSVEAPESPALPMQLMAHLRAELAPHTIAACAANSAGQGPPLADIRIVRTSGQRVGIEVVIDDAVTKKRTMRTLDLKGLPQDAHPVTIALGAAELLRASWAEIKYQHQSEAEGEVPSSVREAVDAKLEKPPPRATLGIHLAAEEFSRGVRQGGADISGAFVVAAPWSLTFRLGGRQSLPTDAADGVVRASAWLIGAGGLLRLTNGDAKANIAATAHIDCVRQQFFAEPEVSALATTRAGTGYLASVGVFGGIGLSSAMQLDAEVDAGTVLKGVSARDDRQVVVAMNGAWVGATFGVSLRAW